MSRVERHRKRREGEVTGVGKVEETPLASDIDFDVNPIVKQEDKDKEITRKKSYNNPIVSKTIDIEEMKEKAVGNKKELFDIETAFERLQKSHKTPDHDTQLEIMSELFSDNGVEYNDTVEFERDFETNRIMISEDELMKLLDERERAHNKALEKKRRKEKRKQEVELNETTAPYVKEDFEIEEVVEIDNEDSIKNRINQVTEEIGKFEENITKKSWPLIIVLVVLVAVLAFLIYRFLN